MDLIELASDTLRCTVSPLGAELQSLTGDDGREWLWDGDPAYWNGRAPILFPIVGALAGGGYRWQVRRYPLEKHGFARRRRFELIDHDKTSATLRLTADEASRAVYPFEFALDLRFDLGDDLAISATVSNRGDGPMPFSFGFHPALRWPARDGVRLIFDRHEKGPVWRIDGDGLLSRAEPLPGDGIILELDHALFAADAMILKGVASRAATFVAADRVIRVAWHNLPDLGLWTKPSAPFLCIEPWAGFNDPVGFAGELSEKPGIVLLAPGAKWTASMALSVA